MCSESLYCSAVFFRNLSPCGDKRILVRMGPRRWLGQEFLAKGDFLRTRPSLSHKDVYNGDLHDFVIFISIYHFITSTYIVRTFHYLDQYHVRYKHLERQRWPSTWVPRCRRHRSCSATSLGSFALFTISGPYGPHSLTRSLTHRQSRVPR